MENMNYRSSRGPRGARGVIPNISFEQKMHAVELHPAEAKLIEAIRAIEFGEIEGLRIEEGLPASYRGARKTCKLA